MKLHTFSHTRGSGWSVAELPKVDNSRSLVLAFGASGYAEEPGPLEELSSHYEGAAVLGCSTAGEIHGARVLDGSIAVAVAELEATATRSAVAAIGTKCDLGEAARSLARELDGPGLRAVFVLSDGRAVNGSDLVRGFNDVLAPSVVVTGGLAGDGDRFQRTWTLVGGRPVQGYVVAVGLYGERLRIGHGSKGGWDSFGPARRVTRSVRNVLYELDGRPALQLYREYLGDLAEGLPATALLFPLASALTRNDPPPLPRSGPPRDRAVPVHRGRAHDRCG